MSLNGLVLLLNVFLTPIVLSLVAGVLAAFSSASLALSVFDVLLILPEPLSPVVSILVGLVSTFPLLYVYAHVFLFPFDVFLPLPLFVGFPTAFLRRSVFSSLLGDVFLFSFS